jgi:hypothetical protein
MVSIFIAYRMDMLTIKGPLANPNPGFKPRAILDWENQVEQWRVNTSGSKPKRMGNISILYVGNIVYVFQVQRLLLR